MSSSAPVAIKEHTIDFKADDGRVVRVTLALPPGQIVAPLPAKAAANEPEQVRRARGFILRGPRDTFTGQRFLYWSDRDGVGVVEYWQRKAFLEAKNVFSPAGSGGNPGGIFVVPSSIRLQQRLFHEVLRYRNPGGTTAQYTRGQSETIDTMCVTFVDELGTAVYFGGIRAPGTNVCSELAALPKLTIEVVTK